MADYDYTINFTDTTKSSFVVKPYTVDGYITPSGSLYSNTDTGISAVSAHTSLAIPGKGIPEYGEMVANDLVFMMEHFANSVRPNLPLQGQIWYKNATYTDTSNTSDPTAIGLYVYDTAWREIVVNGYLTTALDVNSQRIINVANPTSTTDAVNLQYAGSTYVSKAGSTMTGALEITRSSGNSFIVLSDGTDTWTSKVQTSSAITTLTIGSSSSDNVLTLSSNARVGINVAIPEAALDVAGDVKVSNANFFSAATSTGAIVGLVGIDGSNVARIGPQSAGATGLDINAASSSTYVDVRASGNVAARFNDTGLGVGTTAPVSQLHVASSSGTAITVTSGDTSAAALTLRGSTTTNYGGLSYDVSTSTLSLITNGSVRAVLSDVGNMGVGTVSPTQPLHVAGIIYSETGGYMFPDGTVQTTASSGSGTADGVVYAGTVDSTSGEVTLNRTSGLADVVLTGKVAPYYHSHTSSNITYDLTDPISQSVITQNTYDSVTYPEISAYDAIRTLDTAVYGLSRRVRRLAVSATGSTTYTLSSYAPNMYYEISSNKLQVYVAGVKKLVNDRGYFTIKFSPPSSSPYNVVNFATETGLTAGTALSCVVTVNSTAYTITVTPTSSYTFGDMANEILDYITANSIPVSLRLEEFSVPAGGQSDLYLTFINTTSGSGNTVSVSTSGLFSAISYFTNGSSTTYASGTVSTRDYVEVGSPGDMSDTVTFATAPTSGTAIEFLILP